MTAPLTRLLTLSLELQELHDLMPTARGERFAVIAHAIADKQREKDVLEAAWFAGRAIQRAFEGEVVRGRRMRGRAVANV